MFTTEEKEKYLSENPVVEQSRVIWKHQDYFIEKGKDFPITAVICQHNAKEVTQLCIESLLRFYPDINIVVMDDRSDDDSLLYLRHKALICPNIILHHEPVQYNGHGDSLHFAIRDYVKTEYVLIMDNDVILERGGCLEEMIQRYGENKKLFAIGCVQICSYENNGEEPRRLDDITRYINPQFSIVHVPTYHELVEQGTDSKGTHRTAPLVTDGSPSILISKAARDAKLDVEYYPIDKYLSHVGGSGWVVPHTIYESDHDVKLRPFLTILLRSGQEFKSNQDDVDYDIVITTKKIKTEVVIPDGRPVQEVNNYLYGIRFNVHGEFVADLSDEDYTDLSSSFVRRLKEAVIEKKVHDRIEIDGRVCVKRMIWQQEECLKKIQ